VRHDINNPKYTRVCANPACGKMFQQRKPNQLVCSVQCRGWLIAQVRDHSGGLRAKAGLAPRICENPDCGQEFTPVRENQIACSRQCYRKTPSWRESERRQDARPERHAYQNARRQTDGTYRKTALARHGMTVEDYEAKLTAQGGVCALCGREPGVRPKRDGGAPPALHADHDHETGKYRDLLCTTCNTGLGCLQDDPALLRAAAEYIERHRALAMVI
jgi:Recombination endonuclease VII